jgi:hypothetical protein
MGSTPSGRGYSSKRRWCSLGDHDANAPSTLHDWARRQHDIGLGQLCEYAWSAGHHVPIRMLLIGLCPIAYGLCPKLNKAIVKLAMCPIEPVNSVVSRAWCRQVTGRGGPTSGRRYHRVQKMQSGPYADNRDADAYCGGPSRKAGCSAEARPGP